VSRWSVPAEAPYRPSLRHRGLLLTALTAAVYTVPAIRRLEASLPTRA